VAIALAFATAGSACSSDKAAHPTDAPPVQPTPDAAVPAVDPVKSAAEAMIDEGRQTFRYDTFGDEDFWGGALHLHEAIAGSANGGVGPGVSPVTALSVGLKVDVDAVPADVASGIMDGSVDLNDPASTLALLKANAAPATA
jgi:hypothetical protein